MKSCRANRQHNKGRAEESSNASILSRRKLIKEVRVNSSLKSSPDEKIEHLTFIHEKIESQYSPYIVTGHVGY